MKKVLLYFTLALALGSLGIIVYAAKSKKGWFGKQYQNHVQSIAQKVQESLENVMGETVTDTLALARDGNTQKLFVSYALGEDTRRYVAEFQKKQIGMTHSSKIWIVDKSGKILLSTLDQESETKKVSQDYLNVLRDHFVIHKNRPFILFKSNKKEFIVSERFPKDGESSDIKGYILVFYNTQKILDSLPDINLAGTKNNQIFLTSKNYSDQEITALLNRINTYPAGTKKKEKDFLVRLRVNGVVAAYDINSHPYRPWIAMLMILLNLVLLGLVIFALNNAYKTETVPQTITPDPELMAIDHPEDYSIDKISQTKAYYAQPERYGSDDQEIRGLVNDIEQGQTYTETNGSRGIEDMIMESDQDFTSMPDMFTEKSSYIPESLLPEPAIESGLNDDFADVDSGFDFEAIGGEDDENTLSPLAEAGDIPEDEFMEEISLSDDLENINNETPLEGNDESFEPDASNEFDFDSIDSGDALGLDSSEEETEVINSLESPLDSIDSIDEEQAGEINLEEIAPELDLDDEFDTVGIEDSGLSMDLDMTDDDLASNSLTDTSAIGSESSEDLQHASFEDSSDIWDMEPTEEDNTLDDIENEFDKAFEQELGLNKGMQDGDTILESLESDAFAQEELEEKGALFETPSSLDELAVAAKTYDELDLPEGGEEEALDINEFHVSTDIPDITETENETELFAQQDRILQGVDETPFDENGLGPVNISAETDELTSLDADTGIMESPFDIELGDETELKDESFDDSSEEQEIEMTGDEFNNISDELLNDEEIIFGDENSEQVLAAANELDEIASDLIGEDVILEDIDLPVTLESGTGDINKMVAEPLSFDSIDQAEIDEVISSSEQEMLEVEDLEEANDEDIDSLVEGLEDDITDFNVSEEDPITSSKDELITGEELIQNEPEMILQDISDLDVEIPDNSELIEEIPDDMQEFEDLSTDDIIEIDSPPETFEPGDNISENDELAMEDIDSILDGDFDLEIDEITDDQESKDSLSDDLAVQDGDIDLDIDSLIAGVPEIGQESEEDEEISLSMDELSNLTSEEDVIDQDQDDSYPDEDDHELIIDDLVSALPEVGSDIDEEEDISLSMEELSNLGEEEGLLQDMSDDVVDIEEIPVQDDLDMDLNEEVSLDNNVENSDIDSSTLEDLDIDNLVSSISKPVSEVDSEDGDISLDLDDLSVLDLEDEDFDSTDIEPDVSNTDLDAISNSLEGADFTEIDYDDVFSQPPIKLSSISNVEEYASVAQDLAKNSLKMSKVAVYKKEGQTFKSVLNDGFESKLSFDAEDPLLNRFLNNKKSIDIRGDLSKTRYLQERMSQEDLSILEELLVVPIIHDNEVSGIALFGRNKGDVEPTNFQKSELHNLGFLQEM